MGIAAVILCVLAAGLGIGWWFEYNRRTWADRVHTDKFETLKAAYEQDVLHIAELETEIIRLRRIPLTQEPERADNTLIKARSAAQVRQITEANFGRMPEFEQAEEQVN